MTKTIIILLLLNAVLLSAIESPFTDPDFDTIKLIYHKHLLKENKKVITEINITSTSIDTKDYYILTIHYGKGAEKILNYKEGYLEYYISKETMLPEKFIISMADKHTGKSILANVEFDYNKKIVKINHSTKIKTYAIKHAIFDYWGWDFFLMGLPLEKLKLNEPFTFNMIYKLNASTIPINVIYEKEELIDIPAGKFETYKLNLKYPGVIGLIYKQTYWIEKYSPHRIIKSTDYKNYTQILQ